MTGSECLRHAESPLYPSDQTTLHVYALLDGQCYICWKFSAVHNCVYAYVQEGTVSTRQMIKTWQEREGQKGKEAYFRENTVFDLEG